MRREYLYYDYQDQIHRIPVENSTVSEVMIPTSKSDILHFGIDMHDQLYLLESIDYGNVDSIPSAYTFSEIAGLLYHEAEDALYFIRSPLLGEMRARQSMLTHNPITKTSSLFSQMPEVFGQVNDWFFHYKTNYLYIAEESGLYRISIGGMKITTHKT